jgi:uncharacterized protein YbjT (DUF2867 family)
VTKPILVLGTTGRHGGTGAFVARFLLQRGVPVRALTRQAPAQLAPLAALGAEIVLGDLHDRRTLTAALDGVETAYFTYPIADGVVEAAANFASAARASNLKRVVVMSMAVARPDSASHLGRAQWLAEEMLQWAGFSCLHLRVAALFIENIMLLHRADILGDGVIRNSFGADVALSWISGEDAGKLAVAALLHPEKFDGQTAVHPSGGAALTHGDIARLLGQHLNRSLRHETISKDAWRERLIALAATDDRINVDMAGHISAVGAALRQSLPANNMFEAVTGEKPTSVADLIARNAIVA